MNQRNYIFYSFISSILVMCLFAILKYLNMSTGTFLDWVIGLGTFWWLIGITIVPWNMYFSAKEVLNEAAVSAEKGIRINDTNINYAKKLSSRFFVIAITLHIISAIGLYLLAYLKISEIGYFAAVAALLLTFLRPLSRLYDYIAHRLQIIRNEISYPREDVYELGQRIYVLENRKTEIDLLLDITKEDSWATQQQTQLDLLKGKITELHLALDKWQLQNEKDHERLSRKSEEEISKLSEDAQFLNQVRELIRFFKKA